MFTDMNEACIHEITNEYASAIYKPLPVYASLQDIPLVNTSDQYMQVQANLVGKCFSGAKEVSVPPGGTIAYSLVFKPTNVGKHEGTLELSIPLTGEKNVYNLVGRATDPLAEGHIIIETQARKPINKAIAVPNITGQPVEYHVFCDLDCVAGPEVIKASPGQASTYRLTAAPTRSGVYLGSLTFKAADGQYVWYSIEVRASEPPEIGVIEVAAKVGWCSLLSWYTLGVFST